MYILYKSIHLLYRRGIRATIAIRGPHKRGFNQVRPRTFADARTHYFAPEHFLTPGHTIRPCGHNFLPLLTPGHTISHFANARTRGVGGGGGVDGVGVVGVAILPFTDARTHYFALC